MKTLLILLFIFLRCFIVKAQSPCDQKTVKDNIDYSIISKNKAISNRMIFAYPPYFKKGKAPLFFVNGQRVECITYYNPEEIKTIRTLDPAEAVKKYGAAGKNGAVVTTLKETVLKPYLRITTNKIYYQCTENTGLKDTTCACYYGREGRGCRILDLRDTGSTQTIYTDFDNVIEVRHLGAGWDRTAISCTNAMVSGSSSGRIIRAGKPGIVTLTINSCPLDGDCKNTVIKMKAVELPGWIEK